ncbi:MAG: alpha/beta hydrolase [Acidobacteriota bacterium]|nr:alpha/beta hydrolase [Acidobacteriota bacterium]
MLSSGTGDPVILLHPFPLHANYWAPQLAAAPLGWQLLATDLRGFGTQGAGDQPARSLDDYAEDVFAMMDARGLKRAVIAGVSLGGYVAFAMLRQSPARIRALVLANTRMEADVPEAIAARTEMLRLIADEGSAGVARDMPKLLGAGTERAQPALVARVRAMIEDAPAEGMAAAVRAMMARPDSRQALAAFRGAIQIISGDEDALTPPPLQEAMRAAAPQARLDVIAGAGHLASLEQPQAFNALLQRFLHSLTG